MKLRLSDWANIADVTAGIAVVVTLIFLIHSVRENTAATRADSYETLMSDVNDFTLAVTQDSELSRLWRQWNEVDTHELTDDQMYRIILLLRTLLRNYEKAYFAYQYGTLGLTEYLRFEEIGCRQKERLETDGSWSEVTRVLTTEFTDSLEDRCRMVN